MKSYQISAIDIPTQREALQQTIDNLTKPKGSLGRLEELALQIGLIQQTEHPKLIYPHNLIFCADHGIVEEGVSRSPKEITWQQISNFIHGGAGINFLCRQHGFEMVIIDAGVDYDLPECPEIIPMKVRKGTRNFYHEPAMTDAELEICLERGAACVDTIYQKGCNIISLGEMGIGNTSTSSMWMTCLTGIPLADCVGAGSGWNAEGIRRKYTILQEALDTYDAPAADVRTVMTRYGGLEMAMAVGAMLRAAELRMIILVDGFIMTNCILAASRIAPHVLDYAIFGHQGDESGHRLILEYLGVRPLLHMDLRLGEGSGAVCAFPLIDSAVRMLNEMDTFAHASITKYF